MQHRTIVLALVAQFFAVSFSLAQGDSCSAIDVQDIRSTVELLAHPALGGRGTGQAGFDAAGVFLARELRNAGFKPIPDVGDYFDEFTFIQDVVVGEGNSFSIVDREAFVYEDDFLPMLLGFATGAVEANVAFVGYGITAPEYDYDDYADLDVTGKLVVILRHEPREVSADDDFFAGGEMTPYASFTSKIGNALGHGATGVIFAQDYLNHSDARGPIDLRGKPTGRMVTIGTRRPTAGHTQKEGPMMPVISASIGTVESILGDSLAVLQKRIDTTKKPASFVRKSMFVRLKTGSSTRTHHSRNVVGYIPGKRSDEWVILGAHYDHMGTQDDGVYLGADDNASGTAGVLAVARALGERYQRGWRPRRNIVVGFWGAEEWGLQGSWHFANADLIPMNERIAYLNLDMIGRGESNEVFLIGAETNAEFAKVSTYLHRLVYAENRAMARPLDIKLYGDGLFGRTDSASFFGASPQEHPLPVLAFFTGLHADYHETTDTADKVDTQKIAQIACVTYRMTHELSSTKARPMYVPLEEK